MIDRSRTTAAEREVLREALRAYYDRLAGTAKRPRHPLMLSQRNWRKWQAQELLAELGSD